MAKLSDSGNLSVNGFATMRRADSLLTKLNIAIHSRKLAMLPKESMTGKSGMDNIVDFQCEIRSIQIHFEYQRE